MIVSNKIKHIGNTVINKFEDFTEIIYYKEPFNYQTGENTLINLKTGDRYEKIVDRKRKFIEIDGVLHPLDDSTKISDIQETIQASSKRALDNFYGYALCNEWNYFITLTYSPDKVDKNNEEQLKYCWELFRKKIQWINKDVKIICVPERHKSGQLHLHCLVGNIDLTNKLTIAINPKTNKPIKSRYGQQVYNISLWDYGFTTVVELEQGYNKLQVSNYLIAYVTKDSNIGYNKKKYYRTHNLLFKDKDISNLTLEEITELTSNLATTIHKDNDKMTVYRIQKNVLAPDIEKIKINKK